MDVGLDEPKGSVSGDGAGPVVSGNGNDLIGRDDAADCAGRNASEKWGFFGRVARVCSAESR